MSSSLERVTAAFELRELDRVPTINTLEEYSHINDILEKKAIPVTFFVTNKYASKVGNVDTTHILVDAGREEVFEAVRRSIAAAGKGGGYIVTPTNSHPDMSVERVRWMLEAVEEYGHYPLQV